MRRFPVVVVVGPRQAGKTTLVRSAAPDRAYRTLDDFAALDRARRGPEAFAGEAERLTIDEVQRAPDVLLAIKRAVDEGRRPGRFLLTGSANLLMMKHVADSLAGRAVYLRLWPMTEGEKGGAGGAGLWSALLAAGSAAEARKGIGHEAGPRDWRRRVLAGAFPVPALTLDESGRRAWFDGYVQTVLERDLRDLSQVPSLPDFRRLMGLAALRTGQLLNQSLLARDAGLSQPTAHRYLNLLETMLQIVRLPAWSVSRTKRLVKSPRLYWADPALAAHLAGLAEEESLRGSAIEGGLLENFVLLHLLAWRETHAPRAEILTWRTVAGADVDFVVECGRRLLPIEVKAGRSLTGEDLRGLEAFLEEHGRAAPFGLALHTGEDAYLATPRIVAAPIAGLIGPGR
jgi:hypothetical protein